MDRCRSCLSDSSLISLFDVYNDYSIYKMLCDVTGLAFTENDGLPQFICKSCVTRFIDAFEIRRLCIKTDILLRQKILTSSNDPVKDLMFDDSMPLISLINNSDDSTSLSGSWRGDVPVDIGIDDPAFSFFDENILAEALRETFDNEPKKDINIINNNDDCVNDSDSRVNSSCTKLDLDSGNTLGSAIILTTESSNTVEETEVIPTQVQTIQIEVDQVEVELKISTEQVTVESKEMHPLDSFKQKEKKIRSHKATKVLNEEAKEYIEANKKDQKFFCLHCSKVFTNQTSYRRHKNYHKLAKTKCPLCTRAFTHKSNLKRHMMLHKGVRLICDRCEKKFNEPELLYEHLKMHRIEEQCRDTYVLQCELCSQSTSSLAIFTNHMRKIHGVTEKIRPFVCKICNIRFTSKQGMFRHIDNIHENNRRSLRVREKNHLCTECGKKFHTNFHLQVHIRSHTGERPYKCSVCSKAFSQMSGLKMHSYIHSGLRPFACHICNKRFTQYGHVREHLLIHADQKPHVCSICNHSFRVKGNLNTHLKTHERKTNQYECELCGSRFSKMAKLRHHIQSHK